MKWLALPLALVVFAGCDHGHDHDNGHDHDHGTKPPAPAGKVQDPICGMWIAPDGAESVKHDDKSFHFCSDACVKKFEERPGRYAMGYCGCKGDMDKCDCDHCGALAKGKDPAGPCDCGE